MKIKSVGIKGFRGYSSLVEVDFSDLLVLIGKNDIGKSSILEAIDIFFNEGQGSVKLERADINKDNLDSGDDVIEISVEFADLPDSIVIDASNQTTLESEYLLTPEKTLRIIKRYPGAGKERVFISANHPTAPGCQGLLVKKNSELKMILDAQSLYCMDRTRNAELRKAIWGGQDDLQLRLVDIEVAGTEIRGIWERLRSYMPIYTLFQSDRRNSDTDSEVQDPMRMAVREVLVDPGIQEALGRVADAVKQQLEQVTLHTLAKLGELNPAIASSMAPQIPEAGSLKWSDVFRNVAIVDDRGISINKRGSGVRRLVLISFFRGEAERRQVASHVPCVIYAIEEPETSQHPDHQRALTLALISLSKAKNTQVILTTHSPEIVKQLEFGNLRLVRDRRAGGIERVCEADLPYPSLNEVNFAVFDEPTCEYHNELYAFIESEGKLRSFKSGRPTRQYNKIVNGVSISQRVILSEYIRHQIHHPENRLNPRFTEGDLRASIQEMRIFVQRNR